MNIFLTGATGFVGAQLIHRLAQNPEHHLYILYRDEIKKNKLLTQLPDASLHFVKGDITAEHCAVDFDAYDLPAMDYFYHLAALVKFDEELRHELFEINLEGTRHALALAASLQTKHFLYISTAYTVGQNEYAKEELHPLSTPVNNPYEESKRQAEHVVFNAPMKKSILRPAIIIGDSETGEADSKFTLYGFMKALKIFRKKMSRSGNNQRYRLYADDQGTSNLVPVDYVVKVLTEALHAEDEKIYHITNPLPPTNREILDIIKKHLDFEQLIVAPEADKAYMTEEEQLLNSYISVFDPYFRKSIVFEDQHTEQLLAQSGQPLLHLSHAQLDMIIRTFLVK
ncbi:NAD-dependent epimerase/dehydratase family protein [Macrococcus brunensis]|uniref:NAD-dependent epimerase/dehydratase family protein n=1 Tax=Macrococcus brunensis TaxID=198483 RepID=A0A4R6BB72_9STAP|nr:NAD-dependent epimerase/dehydratase family protein [Macrococcus brunensis]